MHPDFSSVLPKPSGHSKRLLSCESGSPRACPRCGPSPGPGAGRGVGNGRLARTPAPSPGHSPARRRAEPSLTGPRCPRPARPSPRSRPSRSTSDRPHQGGTGTGSTKSPGHTPDPSLWKKNFAAHASRHAHARRAPGRASLTCPRAATHGPPQSTHPWRSGRPPPRGGSPGRPLGAAALTA